MRKQKGQGIVEYALILAFVVGVGGLLFANVNGSLADSIRSVFSNVNTLLEEASKTPATTSEEIIKRLKEGRYDGLADVLQGKPSSRMTIASDSEAGRELARKLNIQTKEGDGWFVDLHPDGQYVITYYAADANKLTYSALKEDYNNNQSKYYVPDNDKYTRYPNKVKIYEGKYDSSGKELYYSKNTTTGHVGPGTDGSGMTIYPGAF
ncbi:Flp family type IVb pilin [uncultured Mitsuokella sp.]|uniref:Flp family type IVb pilin n=1 Tax=uncultured Mitsuokella sp. TaxID=453120 RepID=UPI0026139C67|nr:hypothetical protein [uncultured Mitsuokella sp.]